MGTVPEVAGNPIPGPDPGLESTPLVWTLSGEEEKRRGGEIDNLPIGPGGAAHTRPEIDDETRPRRNFYPETAGIIILTEEEDLTVSDTAMGAFWGQLGARQHVKVRRTFGYTVEGHLLG